MGPIAANFIAMNKIKLNIEMASIKMSRIGTNSIGMNQINGHMVNLRVDSFSSVRALSVVTRFVINDRHEIEVLTRKAVPDNVFRKTSGAIQKFKLLLMQWRALFAAVLNKIDIATMDSQTNVCNSVSNSVNPDNSHDHNHGHNLDNVRITLNREISHEKERLKMVQAKVDNHGVDSKGDKNLL